MKIFCQYISLCTFLLFVFSGCASSYHVEKSAGGFSTTKLNKHTYEVRDLTNGHTSSDEIAQFILRRCAQITLEHQKRYFIIASQAQTFHVSHNSSSSFGQAVFKIISDSKNLEEYAAILDAVTVVKETDDIANGKLSAKARQTYNRFASQ